MSRLGRESYLRIPVTMPPELVQYMEEASLRARVTGGKKIANTEIVRAALRAMIAMGVEFEGVKSEEELTDRIMEAKARYDASKKD